MFIAVQAHAAFYIINQDTNRAVAIINYLPDAEELAMRNEIAIESDENISIDEAEYVNGNIQGRMKSQAEKNAEQEALEEQEEMALIYHRMFMDAYKLLKAEGKDFKHMHKHIDPSDL